MLSSAGAMECNSMKPLQYSEDILSIFDLIAVKRGTSEVRWIQFTSLSNVSAQQWPPVCSKRL